MDAATAWAAGLFEGEGYCGILRSKRKGAHTEWPRMSIQMTDEDVVRRFAAVVGLGYVSAKPIIRPGVKPQWNWYAGGFENVQALIARFWALLGARRKTQASAVLLRSAERHWKNSRTTCKRGHPYSGINSKGARVCAICMRESSHRYAANRRAVRS